MNLAGLLSVIVIQLIKPRLNEKQMMTLFILKINEQALSRRIAAPIPLFYWINILKVGGAAATQNGFQTDLCLLFQAAGDELKGNSFSLARMRRPSVEEMNLQIWMTSYRAREAWDRTSQA